MKPDLHDTFDPVGIPTEAPRDGKRHAMNGPVTIRRLKAAMVFSVGLWAAMIALDNIVDYAANWAFVRHVLSMDTVFPDNPLKSRAITDVRLQTAAYWLIIATEWAMSGLCLAGALQLWRARRSARGFAAQKALAACGLTLVFLMYFVGFILLGGEWFCMWQSAIWNGQAKAAMFLTCAMLVLIVLLQAEGD